MSEKKHYVFSARTTEAGLKALNELKEKRGISWDELVIDAVCGHYGLDKETLSLQRPDKQAKPAVKAEKGNGKSKQKAKEPVQTESTRQAS